jgi:hypothetical protein
MSLIVFDVLLPPPAAPDVISRELGISISGQPAEVRSLGTADTLITGLKAPQGTTVSLSLVDVDDAGNRSIPSYKTFEALDTIPPPQPGELGITITGEEAEPIEPPAAS